MRQKFIYKLLISILLLSISVSMVNASSPSCNPKSHESILITNNSDLSNAAISGTGTFANPYLIANWQIKNLLNGYAIKVDNSGGGITKYFNIQCIQSNFEQVPSNGANFIWLVNVHLPTTISNSQGNSLDAHGVKGVQLDHSSNIILDSLSLNRIGSDAVMLDSSDHISIFRSKLKADGVGFHAVNSHHLTIGSPCNLVKGTDCNAFTYDDDRGIWLNNSHDILIQYTITSADDGGGIIIDGKDSYNVNILNGVASGNGPICRMNPLTGIRETTGPKTDIISGIAIINGAHDINVKGYTLQGDSHFDIMNGGDGNYTNRCTGLTEPLPMTPKGGDHLDLDGNCYSTTNIDPAPIRSCK